MTDPATTSLTDGGRSVVQEYAELERRLADPGIHTDQTLRAHPQQAVCRAGPDRRGLPRARAAPRGPRRRARAGAGGRVLRRGGARLSRRPPARPRSTLRHLLVPRDPDDDRDAILEVKAGEGGEESALFAGDLLRMYLRYAEKRGWRAEVIDATESDLGGYKEARLAVKAKGTPQPGEAPWAMLKFEGGVHRVQRVPVTESQGRIHTSAAGVLVMPEVEETDEVEIHANDIRVDVYRSSGPGGQSVNTTDSAVRITHLATGIVVSCQNEKSQLQNKESAMRVLRARLHQLAREQAEAEASAARRSQVRTVDRSERIRTYNFPENRISDHRTGFKAYNLDTVLDGDLDAVIGSCVEADEQARLAAVVRRRRGLTGGAARRRAAGHDDPGRGGGRVRARGRPPPRRAPHAPGRGRGAPPHGPRRGGGARRVCRPRRRAGHAHTPAAPHRPGLLPPARAAGRAGVFVPRPETELLVDLALRALAGHTRLFAPVVVDLATGSGAIALAVKQEHPDARVYAVELGELAHGWAVANRDRLALDVTLERGDAREAFPELDGLVDVVTCNPPYIPDDQVPVDPEVRDHDPALALYGGSADGLALPLAMAAAGGRAAPRRRHPRHGARRDAGRLPAAAPWRPPGHWGQVTDHRDLVGRPRALVAVRSVQTDRIGSAP